MHEFVQLVGVKIFYIIYFTVLYAGLGLGLFYVVGMLIGRLEKETNTLLYRNIGKQATYLTSFIGVPVHELSHALVAKLFGFRINKIKLLQFNDPSGTRGYVNYSMNPNSRKDRIGTFFSSTAPLYVGVGVITLLFWLLLPNTFDKWWVDIAKIDNLLDIIPYSFGVFLDLFSKENFNNELFYLFLIFGVSIASCMTLSKADIRIAKEGVYSVIFVIFIVNIYRVLMADSDTLNLQSTGLSAMAFSPFMMIIYSMIALCLLLAVFWFVLVYVFVSAVSVVGLKRRV